MPARIPIDRFEVMIGEPIVGVSHELFDSSPAHAYLNVVCSCGEVFTTKRQDLSARFKRGNNIQCPKCVNRKNILKRYEEKELPETD